MLKLNTEVSDKITNQTGRLTCYQVESNGNTYYTFQAKGLNPKTGEPVDGRWVTADNVEGGIEIPTPEIPLNILGSLVVDDASGFTGKVTSLRRHINGCVHASVQSSDILKETGTVPYSIDFDIRRLSGPELPILTEEETTKSEKTHPSPIYVMPYTPRFH